MMLRCTSLVPPAIVSVRLKRKPRLHARPSSSAIAPSDPTSVESDLLDVLVVHDTEHLAHRCLGAARVRAGERGERHAEAQASERVRGAHEPTDVVECERVAS